LDDPRNVDLPGAVDGGFAGGCGITEPLPKGHPGPFTSGVDNRRPDFKLKKHDNARGSDFLR
jgi:hypothetical protein